MSLPGRNYYLPAFEGWKVTVTHPHTNQAWHRANSMLTKTKALATRSSHLDIVLKK